VSQSIVDPQLETDRVISADAPAQITPAHDRCAQRIIYAKSLFILSLYGTSPLLQVPRLSTRYTGVITPLTGTGVGWVSPNQPRKKSEGWFWRYYISMRLSDLSSKAQDGRRNVHHQGKCCGQTLPSSWLAPWETTREEARELQAETGPGVPDASSLER
jgi:hypothetical protein